MILPIAKVYVLKDGGESDLDLGNYERFLSIQLTSDHNIITGKIYRDVAITHDVDHFNEEVKIVIVEKYTGLQDSYLSVIKAVKVSEHKLYQFLE